MTVTRRWLPAGLIAAGTALIPWLIVMAAELPPTATARHWGAAWAGLDAMEVIGLLATGALLARRDDRGRLTAMATATLLVADAWLDVMTAPAGHGQVIAIAMAALGEVPVAAVCTAVALRRQQIAQLAIGAQLQPGSHRPTLCCRRDGAIFLSARGRPRAWPARSTKLAEHSV